MLKLLRERLEKTPLNSGMALVDPETQSVCIKGLVAYAMADKSKIDLTKGYEANKSAFDRLLSLDRTFNKFLTGLEKRLISEASPAETLRKELLENVEQWAELV